jgi:hypothetical protein
LKRNFLVFHGTKDFHLPQLSQSKMSETPRRASSNDDPGKSGIEARDGLWGAKEIHLQVTGAETQRKISERRH